MDDFVRYDIVYLIGIIIVNGVALCRWLAFLLRGFEIS